MRRLFPAAFAVLLICPAAFPQSAVPASESAKSAAASTNSAEIRTFQAIEDKWSQSENKHDQYGLDLVLSPLLVNVAEDGDVTTRNQQVAQAITNDDKLYFLSQKVIAVRMLGDVALVSGTYLLRHHVNDKLVTDNGVFTHVYERQRSGWTCFNAQRTPVSENPDSRNGREKDTKSSDASFPFHIPKFGRGDKNSQ
ncbi:MAG: nuclear transport factor 2 family protein [Terracidiphilus sp.]